MKKLFLSTLSLILALSLCAGCSSATPGAPDTDPVTDAVSESTAAITDEGAETTSAATEAQTELVTLPETIPETTPDTTPDTTPETEAAPVATLNGVALSEFVVVYDYEAEEDAAYGLHAAQYVQEQILARTGVELTLVEDNADGVYAHEIVVGETNRDISARLDADTEGMQFAILAEDGKIALEGDYFIIAAAAYFFVETYVPVDCLDMVVPAEVKIHDPIVEDARNYILMIGDGMGVNQTKLFEMFENDVPYSDGEELFYGYYFPYAGFARTDSLSGTTDSAAAGTALSSGYKTINGYVGQDAEHNEIQSLTELAGSLGMGSAVMSTEGSTGATPASFSAHANGRGDESDILSDQRALRKTYGTIVDCGFDFYTEKLVENRLRSHLRENLEELYENEKGFFMMFEEAYIDKHSHNNEADKTFQAVTRFNQAIGVVMEYAFYHPDTFVLITADHETGALLPDGNGGYAYNSGDHSNADVPVFAYGDGGELFHGKTIENIQIPQTIASFMGVTDFGDQSVYTYLTE